METFKHVVYASDPRLWVLTVYYNPCNFQSRRRVYDVFIETMRRSGVNVLTIECAFGNDSFSLPKSMDVIQLRSNTLLWQKERLLNIGASYLPEDCRFVAWVDCDIIFDNQNWILDTCDLLSESCTIVQPYESFIRLTPEFRDPATIKHIKSFAAATSRDLSTLDCGRYDRHGHTGYAWAMRKDIFDTVGLYERAVTGSADHYMAHAVHQKYGFCIENAMKRDQRQIDHLRRWGDRFYERVQGKIGAVSGVVRHLWHGKQERRDYFRRAWRITEYGYNPETDLVALPGRPLEWRKGVQEEKPQLVAYFAEYFQSREEDTV